MHIVFCVFFVGFSIFMSKFLGLKGKDTHTYKMGEDVVVWTDKVGPYNNPQDRVYSQEQFSNGVCMTLPGAVVHIQAVATTAIQLGSTQETYEYSTLGLCELEGGLACCC